jgi:Ca-activated chloride channel family protein
MTLLALLGLLALPTFCSGQGILVDLRESHRYRIPRPIVRPQPRPTPDGPYAIKQLSVSARIADQVARVQVSQSFVNTGKQPIEVCFVFPLPYDGAVNQLTFMVDGKEYEAKLLGADEARRIYQSYVIRNQDPALMEWIGNGMFKTSVFPVPPGAERQVTLRYTQVCRATAGLSEFLFPLSTAKYTSQPVENVAIQVTIDSGVDLKNVYSPTHVVNIQRPTDRQATVKFSTTDETPSDDFRLFWDVGEQSLGASVLSYRPAGEEDGYFLLLVSPEIETTAERPTQKTVVFVVDRSGSMSGKKVEQAKGALRFVLNNLREGDLFNVIAYDSTVESFRPELERVSQKARQEALGFVEGLYAGGSTNIDEALQVALKQLQDNGRPSYVIFLTDGLPTVGERSEAAIVRHAQQANQVRARLFTFGVGYDVNSRLLDKLSHEHFGQSHYVRPDEDIEAHVSRLYNRIGSPVMTDVKVHFDVEDRSAEQGAVVNRTYPRDGHDLFAGDQLVVVGRYRLPGSAKVTISGKVRGEPTSVDFPADLTAQSSDSTLAFIEKLWAVRRVGEIIDEIDLQGKNQELIDELVALSKRHGILTPYTSFLAEEESRPQSLAAQRDQASRALDSLQVVTGRRALRERQLKAQFGGRAAAPAAGPARSYDVATEQEVTVHAVRHVGRKTFFFRGGRWVDSTVTDTQAARARRIERYSDDYFDLIERHGREVARYLALEEEVTIRLDDVVYAF